MTNSLLKNLEYNPNKELTMKKLSGGVPKFDKMTTRKDHNLVLSQGRDLSPPDKKPECKLVPISTIKGRDMKMYTITEAFQNIANDNAKLDYIKNLCFKK
uniref:Uncharacterized protein n=1 Tax=Euplotes harpa TaxID=151035 RepID=A0A7S3JBE4_9SPIT|mmetsp:Transcript_30671/g.35096  ORF Transcript_30671/g.35096 Transcript_30671/m.35096 type:complete len:100 (+) Transcript_30671:136-435(+)